MPSTLFECRRENFSLSVIVLVVFATLSTVLFAAGATALEPSADWIQGDYGINAAVTLCGEPLPLDRRHIWEMLDRELTISVYDRAQVIMWLKRAGRYFPFIEKKLAEADMPDDLKYLAVAESSLLTHIRSRAGAVGTWQFMPGTGRRFGLRKDRQVDERLSFESATQAAISYLQELREMFGSWMLALAAYNCGENRLEKEIREQRVQDYFRLNLPLETERFVFRIAAIKIILKHPENYGYHLPAERRYAPVQRDLVNVSVQQSIHMTDLAEAVDTDFKTLKELNPHFRGYFLPFGTYDLRIPLGGREQVLAFMRTLPPATSLGAQKFYAVKPGDTLSHISRMSGIPVATLRRLNNIEGSLIMVGQKLRLEP